MGTLYIVSTPIGNLRDLSLRAIDVLSKVEIIACEDTRHTAILLDYIRENRLSLRQDFKPTLLSYYEKNEHKRIPQVLNALKNGLNIALVSDAGTPTISDPGFKLVRQCVIETIRVESIPGPSSAISALVVSGLPTDKFLFLGYPPRKPGHRKSLFKNVKSVSILIKSTIIFFEAPHKIIRTLEELKEVFGDMDIVLMRELTKIHEEIRREKISSSIDHFTKIEPKGEFVVLFNPHLVKPHRI